jgi:lipoprotein LpqH
MRRRYTMIVAVLLLGVAACSSAPPSGPTLATGALPGGTAQVTVNGKTTGSIPDVECANIAKGLTEIRIGSAGGQVRALVDENVLKGIAFHDVEGFTGSYWQNLQGVARLDMIDQTYKLNGTAAGFNGKDPFVRTVNGFNVKVAC